jgi:carotenoid cleavage dioxygenase-like enzyme
LAGSALVIEGLDGLTKPSEPVFVARKNTRSEDEAICSPSGGAAKPIIISELLIHDAADLRRTPLARVKLRSRIPTAAGPTRMCSRKSIAALGRTD